MEKGERNMQDERLVPLLAHLDALPAPADANNRGSDHSRRFRIAELAGVAHHSYAETSTFTRAFHTWAGKSSNVWRKQFTQRSGGATQQNCGYASAPMKGRVA